MTNNLKICESQHIVNTKLNTPSSLGSWGDKQVQSFLYAKTRTLDPYNVLFLWGNYFL